MTAVSSASVPDAVKHVCLRLPGREPREPLGELDDGQRRVERRDVREAVDLRPDRGVDLVVGVADGDGQDAAEEVEVLVAVGVPDPQALALRQDDRLLVVLDRRREEELLVLLADGPRERGGRRQRSSWCSSVSSLAAARSADDLSVRRTCVFRNDPAPGFPDELPVLDDRRGRARAPSRRRP